MSSSGSLAIFNHVGLASAPLLHFSSLYSWGRTTLAPIAQLGKMAHEEWNKNHCPVVSLEYGVTLAGKED